MKELSKDEMKKVEGGVQQIVWKVQCNDCNLYVVSSCSGSNQSAACGTHGGVVAGPSCTGYNS